VPAALLYSPRTRCSCRHRSPSCRWSLAPVTQRPARIVRGLGQEKPRSRWA
jgi:hypothetical protein